MKDENTDSLPITKRFGEHFHGAGGALTLEPVQVTDDINAVSGTHTKTHESGWTITGEVHEDWYVWVNEFTASHPELGHVEGDFEAEVKATSEEAFKHFWDHHEPSAWDYGDI